MAETGPISCTWRFKVESAAEEAAAVSASMRREAQRREAALETSNAQLSTALSQAQRKLAESTSQAAGNGLEAVAGDAQLAETLEELNV